MKIYLINPKFPVTYWGFEHSNDLSGVKYTTPPLALATVAALTPPEHSVEICDENIESINFDTQCDLVGLTAYLVQGPRAFEIAEAFRKRGKTVVLGGPITSLDPDGCRGKMDVVFTGEAEYTWPQFLREYQRGAYQPEYVQHEKVDMHDSPVPRQDLLKLKQYTHAAIQTTRGCPFGCEFCDIIVLFGRKVRCKSVAQVIAEMRAAVAQDVDSIFFTDDNFVGNKTYAKELLRAIIEFNTTISASMQYMTQVSINLANDDELLHLLYEAQFNKAFIGIETPRKSSLKEAKKGQNVQSDLVADIRKIQSYNIDVSAGMIVGFDHDDAAIFQEQFDFIMESNISWAMTGMLQAVPKTPLYERLKLENRLDTSNEAVTNTTLEVNIIPKNMSKDELIAGYHWLLKQLYSYENYAKRVVGNLKTYARKPKIKMAKPTIPQIKIVLRTLRYYLLTLDRRRRRFSMQILTYVLLHKPYAFYDAMVHLVSFKHLHAYVYEHLEHAFTEKMATVEVSLENGKDAVLNACEELGQQAAALNQQAALAYDDLKQQMTHAGQQAVSGAVSGAVSEYDELRKLAAAICARASGAYDDVCRQADDVCCQVAEYRKLAQEEYDTFRQQASEAMPLPTLAAQGERLRQQTATLSTQLSAASEELRMQAAVLSEKAATVNQHAAARYRALEEQASRLRQQAAEVYQNLEQILKQGVASHPTPQEL